MIEGQGTLRLHHLNGEIATNVCDGGQFEQRLEKKLLVGREIRQHDLQKKVRGSRKQMARNDLAPRFHRRVKGGMRFVVMACHLYLDEDGKSEAELSSVQTGVIAVNDPSLFQRSNPAETGRRRQTDLVGKLDIGQSSVTLKGGQNSPVDRVESDFWHVGHRIEQEKAYSANIEHIGGIKRKDLSAGPVLQHGQLHPPEVAMTDLSLFVAALAVAYLVPGPDMILLLEMSAVRGRVAALAGAAALALSRAIHVTLSALGLAALLRSAPWAFEAVRLVGVGYLIFIGIAILRSGIANAGHDGAVAAQPRRLRAAFMRGLITNISNPKALLFCSVLLPQFVHPEIGQVPAQFALLGAVLVGVGAAFDLLYIATGASLGRWLARHPVAQRIQRWLFASLLFGFGLRLAFTQ